MDDVELQSSKIISAPACFISSVVFACWKYSLQKGKMILYIRENHVVSFGRLEILKIIFPLGHIY